MLIKIFTYIFAHFTLQTDIIFEECRDGMIDSSQVMAWLSYEIVAFYLNIVAMSVFLLFSSLKKFYSIRDRLGFATGDRKTLDFLNYCKDDIHWFQAWFTMLMLCVMAVTMRTRSHEGLGMSGGVLLFRHLLEILLLGQLYFSNTFEVQTFVKIILTLVFVVNIFLIKAFFDLEEEHSVYWAPALLVDIVLHFILFGQMAFDYFSWNETQKTWEKELMFNDMYNDADNQQDEDKIRLALDQKILTEGLPMRAPKSSVNQTSPSTSDNAPNSAKSAKEMKLAANMYTVCYCAFMKKNKEKFKLKQNDQMDIFYRAFFMFVIQMTFIVCLLVFDSFDLTYKNDTAVNFCLFFTVLILHWQCLPDARNGMYMMKYALTCPEEFNHPTAAFVLGFLQTTAIFLTEICNLLKSFDQKKPQDVIVRFVGFGLILSVPKLLHPSMEGFDVPKAVGKLVLKKSRKASITGPQEGGMIARWAFNMVYCLFKWFFVGFYYYFFPFVVIFAPLFKITYLVNMTD